MELDKINTIISEYDKLIVITEKVITEMSKIDPHYSISRGVEEISFSVVDGIVDVTCDDTCMGCYGNIHFSFPIYYLTLELNELIPIIEKEKIKREIGKEERERFRKEQQEKNEYNTFLKLSKKFKL